MLKIIEIKNENIFLLQDYISNNTFPNTFRYFNKRDISIIKNHIITILLSINDKIIGYAHIDQDDDKYWFGICIDNNYQGKGYGTKIMEYILNHEKIKNINKINLSVDKTNSNAISLYKKFNFIIINEYSTYFLMEKTLF
jgi:ribosomal protein S18 acetylase RimI-like enzyme